jgi:LPS-assembly protein
MQKNSLFFLLLFYLPLFGEERLYFLSDRVSVSDEKVTAYRDATIIFKNKYMRAEQILYNEEAGFIELFGDITLVENGIYFFVGDYAKVSIDGKKVNLDNMFLYHKPRHIWIYSSEANSTNNEYILEDTFLSSCRSEDPDWGFYVNSGVFDKNEELFELYNIILYASDIPVFYIPYLNFSIKRERKSGLLVPQFGLSVDEGFYISQPIYLVPNEWSDFEISPQVRTQRGNGGYLKYRFTDSFFSKGEVTAGYFREKNAYFEQENLANQEHYGVEFLYRRNSLLRDFDDGLYVDLKYLNDIDYMNLKPKYKNENRETTNLIDSRVNYYISKDEHSLGLYSRYTIDTSKDSNRDTLQITPHIQYHYDISPFLNNFLYSFDYNFKNFKREVGATATQHEVTVPIIFYTSFYDDYWRFRVTEHLYGSQIDFYQTDKFRDSSNLYMRYYHQIELFSDLSKKYEGSFHSINFGLNLILPDHEHKKGFYSPEEVNNEECMAGNPCEFQTENRVESKLEFKFSQYLHQLSGDEVLYHKIIQPVNIENREILGLGLFENEFRWQFDKSFSLYNNFIYSVDDTIITQVSSIAQYKLEDYSLDVSHFAKNDKFADDLEFVSSEFSTVLNDKYSFSGHYSYDLIDQSTRSWGVGYEMKKRCWNYKVDYKYEYLPNMTKSGTSTQENSTFYFLIELYPLGGFEYGVK